MIHSMTAFARLEERHSAGTLCWELRTVNHRYLEVSPRLPDEFRVLEGQLRERAAGALRRGKLDCQLRFQQSFLRNMAGRLSKAMNLIASTGKA